MFKIIGLLLVSISLNAQAVYKTPSGKKYHLASCPMEKNVSEQITVSEATDLGLHPCKICLPQNGSGQRNSTTKAHGQNITTPCKGFTKAGHRCKHMTRIGNGYCYQHQP